METKLTLRLDGATIEKAKRFARENQTSLSDMVEGYFNRITQRKAAGEQIAPIIKELSGILKATPAKINFRDQIADHIARKHR